MLFLKTLYQILIMFFYMVPAFILKKIDWVKTEHLYSISTILLYVIVPGLVLDTFQKCEFSKHTISELGKMFLMSFLMQMIAVGILILIFYKKIDEPKYRVAIAAGIFGNTGFVGLPIVIALFPGVSEALIYVIAFTMIENVLFYTVVAYCVTFDKKFISVKKAILNPATLSFIFAFIVYLTKWKYPDELADAIASVGKMSTISSMQLLGIRLASLKSLLNLFRRPFVYLAVAIKLVIFPLFCYVVCNWIPWWDQYFVPVLVVEAATPTAAFVSIISEQYGKEQELASNSVLLTSIACVATLPTISLLFE